MDDDAYDRTEAEDKLEVLFDDLSHLLSVRANILGYFFWACSWLVTHFKWCIWWL